VTAAAEYRRATTGLSDGFEKLRQLPDFLAAVTDGQSNLLNLVPPAKRTRRLFAVLIPLIGNTAMPLKIIRAIGRLTMIEPLAAGLALVPVVIMALIPVRQGAWEIVGTVVIQLVLLFFAVVLLAAYHAIHAAGWLLPDNGFGFSTGMVRCSHSVTPGKLRSSGALPPARDFPIIVAARMSLSFPILFSMVPMYSVDFTTKANQGWVTSSRAHVVRRRGAKQQFSRLAVRRIAAALPDVLL